MQTSLYHYKKSAIASVLARDSYILASGHHNNFFFTQAKGLRNDKANARTLAP